MKFSTTTRLIALALLAHLALSWPLWQPGSRVLFPLLPAFGIPFPQNEIWAGIQAWGTVGFTLLLLWMPQRRWVMAAVTAWFLWMIVQDMNRLQPWMYFYLLAWGLLLAHTPGKEAGTQTALRWLLAAVYAWGGFNKLTPYFAEDNFPWFCEAFFWTKPLGQWPAAGYGVALVELLFAPGLLWRVSRPAFRWIVPAFHLFIIVALSPLGLDWNTVVIPWNVAMGGMVWVLFGPTPILPTKVRDRLSPKGEGGLIAGNLEPVLIKDDLILRNLAPRNAIKPPSPLGEGLGVGLLALAWLLPAFNIFHLWPEPLSWKMYSNTQTEATFYCNRMADISVEWEQLWDKHGFDGRRKLLLDDWAFDELHVPVYNCRRTFLQTARYLCEKSIHCDTSGLMLLTVNRWDKSAEKWETIPCAQIAR